MIRTLLIDNYDSFTFNLYHYLAEVNGVPPVVVPNDEQDFDLDDISGFDNIVISPGPGSPLNPADVGICAAVLQKTSLPVLGICLGHQGIAHSHGATVTHAPMPVHGRTSEIFHEGTGIFEGIPSPFQAVRYHSLAVTQLPEELTATAITVDDVVMGLSHRDLPRFGVQFHPESIETQHGLQLLRNFARLTTTRRAEPAGTPLREQLVLAPQTTASRAMTRYQLHIETVSLNCSDEALFSALYGDDEYAIWLDGNHVENPASRFSIMGSPDGPEARVARADTVTGTVTVCDAQQRKDAHQRKDPHQHKKIIHSGFFDWLESELASAHIDAPPLPFDFALGWVGYLGYGLKAELGVPDSIPSPTPDACLMFLDRAVVVDHATATAYILALSRDGSDAEERHRWFARTAQSIPHEDPTEPQTPTIPAPRLVPRHSEDDYARMIQASLRKIADGESYEICLTNMISAPASVDPMDAYRLLRRHNPTPFGAFIRSPEVQLLSTSPERFLRITAGGHVESKPIKGTRPRGRTAEEDAALRTDLQQSEKDRAENLMIVDLVRHDLGRTAALGSVRVDRLFEVESYATVHQLVSTVSSELLPGVSPVACVRAAFPPGSMTGAPKRRTMQIIDALEGGPRGAYSGAIGYFSLSGAVDLSVAIRTLVVADSEISYGVGGAIVALSDPQQEYEETIVKARPLLQLFGDAPFPRQTAAATTPEHS